MSMSIIVRSSSGAIRRSSDALRWKTKLAAKSSPSDELPRVVYGFRGTASSPVGSC